MTNPCPCDRCGRVNRGDAVLARRRGPSDIRVVAGNVRQLRDHRAFRLLLACLCRQRHGTSAKEALGLDEAVGRRALDRVGHHSELELS
jgi:hypothetical protein